MKYAAIVIILFILNGCAQQPIEPSATLLPTSTVIPQLPPTSTSIPEPTEVEWLPYDDSVLQDIDGGEICQQSFTAQIPKDQTANLTREQIGTRLFETYLAHYSTEETPKLCRLTNFRIEKVETDPWHATYLTVLFSVQVPQAPTNWVAGNGDLAPEGWIVNKNLFITLDESDTDYTLKIIGTGP